MAKDQCSEYDTAAANNTVVGDVDISEGTAPSNINNSIRELMSHLKTPEFQKVSVVGDTSAGDDAAVGYTAAAGLVLTGQGTTNDVTIRNDVGAEVCGVPTGTDDLRFPDNAKIEMGAAGDLAVYHDGSHSWLKNSTGEFYMAGSVVKFLNAAGDETMITGTQDAGVELYFNNSKKAETVVGGFSVTGDFTATGNVTAYSSAIAKTNVRPLKNALDMVEKLRGVSFKWKDREDEGKNTIGFIMEEVAEAVPELARETGVMYQNTVAVLVEAVKELRAEIRDLKAEK